MELARQLSAQNVCRYRFDLAQPFWFAPGGDTTQELMFCAGLTGVVICGHISFSGYCGYWPSGVIAARGLRFGRRAFAGERSTGGRWRAS
jgi:hypothetical protein